MKKISAIFLALAIISLVFSACDQMSETQVPTILIPANPPSPSATPTVIPATITFVNNECIYSGPLPLPAGTELSVEMTLKDNLPGPIPVLGVVVLTLNQGKTEQDLLDNFKSADSNAAAVYQSVGAVEVMKGKNKTFTIRVPNSPVYIVCYYDPMSENSFIIGPFESR